MGRIKPKERHLDLVSHHTATISAGFDHPAHELLQHVSEWLSSCHQRFLGDPVELGSLGGHLEALRARVEPLGGDFLVYGPDRVSKLYDPLKSYLWVVNSEVEAELPDVMLVILILVQGAR